MPIPFRGQDNVDDLGTAAFLKIEADGSKPAFRGALFQVNARGEPIEFTYNRVETPNTFLWRPGDVRRLALNHLTMSLLKTSPKVPRLLFCLAREVPSDLFCNDLQVSVPVCRVASSLDATPFSTLEKSEEARESDPLHLFWYPELPATGSSERALVERLLEHDLVLEPFDRASLGLREVYAKNDGERP